VFPRWAGGWVDLLDGLDGAAVLLAGRALQPSASRLAQRAGLVGTVHDGEGVGEAPRWDLVAVEGRGVAWRPGLLAALLPRLAPTGRVVAVGDSISSPLRVLDQARSRPVGPPGSWTLSSAARALAAGGLAVRQRFGLLRSSAAPVTAFDLDAPDAAAAVLRAAAAALGDGRAAGLHLLRRLVATPAPRALVPGWMLVASPAGRAWVPAADRPTGRIGTAKAPEAKIVRGSPPCQLEKVYAAAQDADNEWTALETLRRARVSVAPRALARPTPTRVRQSWLAGEPLRVHRLAAGELRHWVAAAARVLGAIQQATAAPDGSVLVHGDYWLGNLLARGSEVAGVVDWTGAHRGGAGEDLDHLVSTAAALKGGRGLGPAQLWRLARQARDAVAGSPACGGPAATARA
jgi:aminoglycoside phosphotransferase (APT) family kinase protein